MSDSESHGLDQPIAEPSILRRFLSPSLARSSEAAQSSRSFRSPVLPSAIGSPSLRLFLSPSLGRSLNTRRRNSPSAITSPANAHTPVDNAAARQPRNARVLADLPLMEAMDSVVAVAAVPDPVFVGAKPLRRSERCANRPRAPTYAEEEEPKQSTGRPKKKRDAEAQVVAKVARKKTVKAEPKERKLMPVIPATDFDAKLRVKETMRAYNVHYRHSVQEERERVEAAKQDGKAVKQRPDLKTITKMQENNSLLYTDKIIGAIPGIDVGYQFNSQAEMVVLGIHCHWVKGICYMGKEYKKTKGYENLTFPFATSIVMSGIYEDDLDKADEIIYTGEGGNDVLGKHLQFRDQKWEGGNLALGVVNHWLQYGVQGHVVYKYKLKRLEGQPSLTTSEVRFTRGEAPRSTSELPGLILDDISGGQENFPIPATNLVDNPPVPPPGFAYINSLKNSDDIKIPSDCTGCDCEGDCASNKDCSCARLNGSNLLPYVSVENVGRLVESKAVVFECGPNCSCNRNCVNRTSQQGLQYRLEVFKTASKGWGVRSWDTILAGVPICEYVGVLRRSEDVDGMLQNNYLFNIDCLQTMKGLDGRKKRAGSDMHLASLGSENDSEAPPAPEYCIDGGSSGNVTRFINHSCNPNLFVQCVLTSHRDVKLAKLMLFAADTIPPLQELCYDYGYALDSVVSSAGDIVKLPCYCGAADCRERLY